MKSIRKIILDDGSVVLVEMEEVDAACLWLNRALPLESSNALKKEFPQLFILTSNPKNESELNAFVMTQLAKLKKFIEGCQ